MKSAVLASLFALAASAATINFDSPTGTLGTSQVYTGGGYSVTAYGFSSTLDTTQLYGKDDGGDEDGVGLAHFLDHEIEQPGFIQILVTGLVGLQFKMGSTTDGERWQVDQSNTLGVAGSAIMSGEDENWHAVTTTDTYLTFLVTGAPESNVLLSKLIVEGQVPEPNAAAGAALGLALILTARSRHWRQKAR